MKILSALSFIFLIGKLSASADHSDCIDPSKAMIERIEIALEPRSRLLVCRSPLGLQVVKDDLDGSLKSKATLLVEAPPWEDVQFYRVYGAKFPTLTMVWELRHFLLGDKRLEFFKKEMVCKPTGCSLGESTCLLSRENVRKLNASLKKRVKGKGVDGEEMKEEQLQLQVSMAASGCN